MGSAAAWHAARRGRDVLLLERFGAGHAHGASHGASRNFNVSYSDPTYVAMLVEALPLWRELEAETETSLLSQVGIANHGSNPAFDEVAAALAAAGIPSEFLPVEEAERRWPGMRFDTRVLFTPTAGRLHADRAVAALQSAASASGARVLHDARVVSVDATGDDSVTVVYETVDGRTTVTARRAIVTVGAWTSKLLAGRVNLPRLVVTQEQPAHFPVLHEQVDWPGFNHARGSSGDYDYWYSGIYGMYTPGQGVKAGWHGTGPVVDPDARDFTAEPVQLAALQRYAREWLPGTDWTTPAPISCTYTTGPESNFLLDAVGPIVVGAGFAGHGFKFTPTVGRILADLADGTAPAPDLFRLR
jgi:sarcosine oxidase